jgi:SAM-dependent methyltransferase
MIADWQLPPGVNRGLWDYIHDPAIARAYDDHLAACPLLEVDRQFVARHFSPPGRLLDLGCGTGRLLVPLACAGFWAVGADLSEEMLKVAGDKADAAGVTVHRLKANLVDLAALDDRTFDFAVCLFSTLGMVMGAGNRRRVIEHVFRLLRPGGKFVLHVHNRWFNVWHRQLRGWLVRDWLRSLVRRAPGGDHVMPAHQGIAGLTLHLFTRDETTSLLRQTGFRILEVMPVSLCEDGRLPFAAWFERLRAYGYLVAAQRP